MSENEVNAGARVKTPAYRAGEYRTFSCINEECDSGYLAHITATSWFRQQLLAATQGIGARRERVRPEMLLGLAMPFPVISRQIEAAGLLEKQVAGKRLSAQSSEREAALLPSLLDRIFNPYPPALAAPCPP